METGDDPRSFSARRGPGAARVPRCPPGPRPAARRVAHGAATRRAVRFWSPTLPPEAP